MFKQCQKNHFQMLSIVIVIVLSPSTQINPRENNCFTSNHLDWDFPFQCLSFFLFPLNNLTRNQAASFKDLPQPNQSSRLDGMFKSWNTAWLTAFNDHSGIWEGMRDVEHKEFFDCKISSPFPDSHRIKFL